MVHTATPFFEKNTHNIYLKRKGFFIDFLITQTDDFIKYSVNIDECTYICAGYSQFFNLSSTHFTHSTCYTQI